MVLNPKLPLASCCSVNKLNYWREYKFVIICQASANKWIILSKNINEALVKFSLVLMAINISSQNIRRNIFSLNALFFALVARVPAESIAKLI